ncbi:hypothetical protein WG66_003888, partial [Moniliophthora roreri]
MTLLYFALLHSTGASQMFLRQTRCSTTSRAPTNQQKPC